MSFVLSLFLGLLTAAIGVLPPGIINMTAAKISIQDGKNRAFMFTFGALIVIFFQTLVALIFAKYISNHNEIGLYLREIGFVLFGALTIYFFWIAKTGKSKKKEDVKIKSKRSRFFLGMLISVVNLFPIPYYAFSCITFASFNYFSFEKSSIYTFAFGTVLGSFIVFYSYIAFFKRIESKTKFITKNMNQIIGTVTGAVSLMSLVFIVRYYFKY
jgi:threonine/homoserine/homoserine lactone efflux protein